MRSQEEMDDRQTLICRIESYAGELNLVYPSVETGDLARLLAAMVSPGQMDKVSRGLDLQVVSRCLHKYGG